MELKTRESGKNHADSHEETSPDESSPGPYSGPGITNRRKSHRPKRVLEDVARMADWRRTDPDIVSKRVLDQIKQTITASIRSGEIELADEDTEEESIPIPVAAIELLEAVRKELRNAHHQSSASTSKPMKRDPLHAARQRGHQSKRKLLEEEGGTYSAAEVAELLDLSRQAVDDRRKAGTLIGLKGTKRGYRYPKWQFSDDGLVLDGLPEILTTLGTLGSWAKAAFILNRNKRLNDERPLDLLRRGESKRVHTAAEHYGDHDGY